MAQHLGTKQKTSKIARFLRVNYSINKFEPQAKALRKGKWAHSWNLGNWYDGLLDVISTRPSGRRLSCSWTAPLEPWPCPFGKLATTFTSYRLPAHLVDFHVCFWQVLQGKGTVKVWLHLFKPMAMVCKATFTALSWGDTNLTHCHQSPRASTWGTICTKRSAWTCLLAYVALL